MVHLMFFLLEGIKDIPPSGVTRPICGIMGTVRLVAGRSHIITFHIEFGTLIVSRTCFHTVTHDFLASSGMYLIVITRKRKVGDLFGHTVWKAVEFDVISYKKTILHLTDIQVIKVPNLNFQSNADVCDTLHRKWALNVNVCLMTFTVRH